MTSRDRVSERAEQLRAWLVDDAFPLWAEFGVDRSATGGFYEVLGDDRSPVASSRRARLVARQIYCFAAADELGWAGPSRELVAHGVAFLREHLIGDNGEVWSALSPDGDRAAAGHDLYDYAFVLFALAWAHRVDPGGGNDTLARRILAHLREGWSHRTAGFEEQRPPVAPLKSNPHMHLFEAALEWRAADLGPGATPWGDLADHLSDLAVTRLISAETGAVAEYFDRDWNVDPTRNVVEPGHQFEWAWLLDRWAGTSVQPAMRETILRLVQIGEVDGIDPNRDVAVGTLEGVSLRPTDGSARLWPQTERIKAWTSVARRGWGGPAGTDLDPLESCARAIDGLLRFREGKPAGMWHEQLNENNTFNGEPTRASSLYHIVVAASELGGFLSSQKAS